MEYFSIKEISKMFGVSEQTLRYYDKIDLLKPGYVDPSNNYRYYFYEQFFNLSLILQLKELGVSLKEIKKYMEYSKINKLEEILNIESEYISKKIVKLESMQRHIKFILEKIDIMNKLDSNPECYLEYIEDRYQYRIEMDFEIKEIYSNMKKLFVSFINEVLKIKKINNINRREILLIMNEKNLLERNFSKYESIGFLLDSSDFKSLKQNSLFTKIDKNYFAIIHHFGAYSNIELSYNKLIDYISKNNYKIIGNSIEKAVISLAYTRDETKYITEIQIPVRFN